MGADFLGRDVVSIDDFSREDFDFVIQLADEIKRAPARFSDVMRGRTLMPLFFENSTRTNMSFQMAMLQMGGSVGDFDKDTSSLKKGESLKDTLKMVGGYRPDLVVMRHYRDGAARFAADVLDCPLINAGDGKNQHPTQTMLDLMSVKEICGAVEGVEIAFVGDLKYGRTVHSLAVALSLYRNCRIYFVSPDSLKMPSEFLDLLKEKGVSFSEHGLGDLGDICKRVGVLYMTRIQRERFPEGAEGEQEYDLIKSVYCLKKEMLADVRSGFKVLHPLPKVFEIESEVDEMDCAYYYEQAANGMHVRKALLQLLVGGRTLDG
ncbi:aspartate carbamoyltransferase [Candidatus Pacearchaeota archaeon]|jgi:aspartate carbamoyltransferase catalytic subunit|nr:aspartate carbamoyltransferase [Candidatus Pacearchaeota archaeon]